MRVARIFNTFGPRMHMNDGRVVSNFILQALQGEPLTVGAIAGWAFRSPGQVSTEVGRVPEPHLASLVKAEKGREAQVTAQ